MHLKLFEKLSIALIYMKFSFLSVYCYTNMIITYWTLVLKLLIMLLVLLIVSRNRNICLIWISIVIIKYLVIVADQLMFSAASWKTAFFLFSKSACSTTLLNCILDLFCICVNVFCMSDISFEEKHKFTDLLSVDHFCIS